MKIVAASRSRKPTRLIGSMHIPVSNDQNLWMSSGQGAPSREMIFEGFQF
jgi:hypothetical protein